MNTAIELVAGLGNPGPEYHQTRHNAGADFVLELAHRGGITLTPDKKFAGLSGQIALQGKPLRLLVPTTFMNRSGQSVAALANFYKLPPQAILVAHDELDLAPGVARLKLGGGHGGHNGLRDIIQSLGNNSQFARLRIGIGHPGNAKQVTAYVLKKAPHADFELTASAIDSAIAVLPMLVEGRWNDAMKELHTSR